MSLDITADTRLVDVRSPAEFQSGHLEGALNLPLDQLQALAPSLLPDRQADLLLYCASGARSGFGCAMLAEMGYLRVRNGGGAGQLSLAAQIPVRRD